MARTIYITALRLAYKLYTFRIFTHFQALHSNVPTIIPKELFSKALPGYQPLTQSQPAIKLKKITRL